MDAVNSLPNGPGGYTRLTSGLMDALMRGEMPENPGRRYRMTFTENRACGAIAPLAITKSRRPPSCVCVAFGMSEEDKASVEALGVRVVDSRPEEAVEAVVDTDEDYICVADCSDGIDICLVDRLTRMMLKMRKDGLFGEMDSSGGRIECGGAVYGLSRRVFDDCGIKKPDESQADFTARCGAARYRSFSAGVKA